MRDDYGQLLNLNTFTLDEKREREVAKDSEREKSELCKIELKTIADEKVGWSQFVCQCYLHWAVAVVVAVTKNDVFVTKQVVEC